MRARHLLTLLSFALTIILAGCLESFPQPKTPPTSRPAKAAGGAAERDKTPQTTASDIPGPQDGMLSGAHILIAYDGARRSKATRSKAEALALAKKLAAKLGAKVQPDAFAALASKHSDGPSGQNGGDLGTWKKGRMVAAFDKAILKLPFNGVTAEPVETPFGFHLIMRYRVFDDIQLDAAQVLISHVGARRMPANVTRDRAAAQALCRQVAKEAAGKDLAAFSKLVARYSDAPDKASGGRLGVWSARTSPLPAALNRAVYQLKIGAVSGPVMSPFGCHVMLRLKPNKS